MSMDNKQMNYMAQPDRGTYSTSGMNPSQSSSDHINNAENISPVIFNNVSIHEGGRNMQYIDHHDPSCHQDTGADYNLFHSRISVPYIGTNPTVMASPTRPDYPNQPHESHDGYHQTHIAPNYPQYATDPSNFNINFHNSQVNDFNSSNRTIKRTGKSAKPKRTPRPANAFILYRKAKQADVIRDNPGVSNKDVSCIIGNMWRNEAPSIKDSYQDKAEVEKQRHKETHPDYKYQPRKPKAKRQAEANAAAANTPVHYIDQSHQMTFHPYSRPTSYGPHVQLAVSDYNGQDHAYFRNTSPLIPNHHSPHHSSGINGNVLSPPLSSNPLKSSNMHFWPPAPAHPSYHNSQLPPTPINMSYASPGNSQSSSSPSDYYYSSQQAGAHNSYPGQNPNADSYIGHPHPSNGTPPAIDPLDSQSMNLLVQSTQWQ